MDNVGAALEGEGHVVVMQPSRVTSADTEAADIIVSIGCDKQAIPTDKPITEWDVPMLSEDFVGSMLAIRERVEALARDLAGHG